MPLPQQWGTGVWGQGFWGGPLQTVLPSVSHAVLLTENTVRVFLTAPVNAVSQFNAGDALNPATWAVVKVSAPLDLFTVVSVAKPTSANTVFDVSTLELFAGATTPYRIATGTLRVGNTLIGAPRYADFLGVTLQLDTPGGEAAVGPRDLLNLPVQRNPLGGTLQINSAGDYVLESGRELVKKLIYRRLTTLPGEFFHLPNYGLPLQQSALQTATGLVKLKAEIERQARLEPEVSQAAASVTLTPTGILTVSVRCSLRPDGATLAVSLQLPITNATTF